jgi:lipopolysaccharide export system protein LptC
MTTRSDPVAEAPRSRPAAEFAPRSAGPTAATLLQRRRFVRFMKFVLPLVALGTVAAVIAWPQLTKRHAMLPLSFSDVETANAALVMNNPRYRGTDAKNQPYIVTADRAIQDSENDQQITLDNVQADLAANDGSWWSLSANTGLYDGGRRILHLFGDVSVFGDNGYEMHGTSAEVDLATSQLSSDEKVWGQSGVGFIQANGLRVFEKGRVIVFLNGVKTTIHPRKERG